MCCFLHCLWFASRTFLFLVLLLAPLNLTAAEDASGQLWANVTLCYPKTEKLYFELDFEPKVQFSGHQKWGNLDATPLVEYYPNKWIDLTGEATIGYTQQNNDMRSFEFTPRIGIRLHLFQNIRDMLSLERLPERVSLANLTRIEYRTFSYFGDLEATHEWRLRNRLEFKLPLNHKSLSIKRTLYIMADVEAYIPLGDRVSESFASKTRVRGGLGFRGNYNWRLELLFIRDWARDTLEDKGSVAVNAIDLRLMVFF